ncbi:Alpha/beta hydrolase [Frankia sp. AiPs1]|uniref:prolyl oligopeptidase family serine peptidase n=1 Tax=Frankia sp. AiPa1 TaxID=573492 RepID=UPI00202B0EE5|nr:prolyl oligopeptidase family serine peptidase [Frankia sp. AiPa1]MCL9761023.1 alpha/beta hydrolase [Frankia sp. AiPa1]
MTGTSEVVVDVAAGVPFVAVPPDGGARPDTPTVLAWHLLDAPRTERAFASALPLRGLDAWRVYLGLPLSGSRLPEGGQDELRRRVFADPVLNVQQPVIEGALHEVGPALTELRSRLNLGGGPLGVLGGSSGAAAALLVLLESGLPVQAAVLVNPLVQLRDTIDALSVHHGVTYDWQAEASAFADRTDFPARAAEIAALTPAPAVLIVTGADDLVDAIQVPATRLAAHLQRSGVHVDHRSVPDLAHFLADEPGTEPAPQLPKAAEVDQLAAAWFREHLAP